MVVANIKAFQGVACYNMPKECYECRQRRISPGIRDVIGHLGCFLVKSDFEIREFSYNFKFEISAIAISVNPGCPEVVSKVCHLLSRYEIRQCIIRCIALLYAFVGAGYASQ